MQVWQPSCGIVVRVNLDWVARDSSGRVKQKGHEKRHYLPGEAHNGATTEGLNYFLDTAVRGTAQDSTWFSGLINNASYTGVALADTMGSHAGWIETHTTYDEATRVAWSPGAASAGVLTAAGQVFTFNTDITVKGIFVVGVSTKGGTTGTLLFTGLFDANAVFAATDTLTLTTELQIMSLTT
jgi:hypothetical protein